MGTYPSLAASTLADMRVLTISVHDRFIFPGTGSDDCLDHHTFNASLASAAGDYELFEAAGLFVGVAELCRPDLNFIATGADGLSEDPISSLEYSVEGMVETPRFVRRALTEAPAAAQPVADGDEAWVARDAFPYEPHPA